MPWIFPLLRMRLENTRPIHPGEVLHEDFMIQFIVFMVSIRIRSVLAQRHSKRRVMLIGAFFMLAAGFSKLVVYNPKYPHKLGSPSRRLPSRLAINSTSSGCTNRACRSAAGNRSSEPATSAARWSWG